MAETCLHAKETPGVDLDGYRLAEYEASLKAKYIKSNDALFEDTREWCEDWYCPTVDEGWAMAKLVAYIKRSLNTVLELALTAVYTLLDSLISILVPTIGETAKLIDETLIFMCYMSIFIANLFLPPTGKYSYSESCCGASAFLEIIASFIQEMCDGAVEIYKRLLKIWYQICYLYELLSYSCDCERIKQENYEAELKAAMEENGGQYDYKIEVPPPCTDVGGVAPPDTGVAPAGGAKPTYYIKVNTKDPKVSTLFRQHVEYTVLAYNKWPYGVEGFCPMRAAEYGVSVVTWQPYVAFLVSNWLSSSNLFAEGTNPNGYSAKEHEAQMGYCKTHMPKELFNYVVSCVADTERNSGNYW